MIKISDIYVSTTGSLLQLINIHLCMENSQHPMLYSNYFNNISIYNYKREIFPPFMLGYGMYVTCSLNWVYVKLITNIKC